MDRQNMILPIVLSLMEQLEGNLKVHEKKWYTTLAACNIVESSTVHLSCK